MVDLDMMPPDWEFAKKHAKANRPGIFEGVLDLNSSNDFCPCCHQPIIKEDVALCGNSKELDFMGFGFPLYFIFIKYCMILLVILICSYSVISLYWGAQYARVYCSHRLLSNTDDGAPCSSKLIYWAHIETEVYDEQTLSRIISFVAHLLGLLYVRDMIRKTMEYYNEKTTSLSDFSILMKNLPPKEGLKQNITDFIHSHFDEKWEQMDHKKKITSWKDFQAEEKVVDVILLPDLQEYYQLQKQKKKLIKQKKQLLKKQDKIESRKNKGHQLSESQVEQLNDIQEGIRKVDNKINLHHEKINDMANIAESQAKEDKLVSLTAIVSLHSEYLASQILKYARKNTLNSQLVGNHFGQFECQITIQKAPDPTEIIWKNSNKHRKKIYSSWLFGWILSILFIVVITVGFYFLLYAKGHYLQNAIEEKHASDLGQSSNYKIAVFLVFFIIVLIILFNKLVMGAVLHHLTELQIHFKTSTEEFSFAIKYTLGLFFTTALMTLAIEDFTFKNYFVHEFGVIEEESIMFIINAGLVPFIWLVNPWQLSKWFMRKIRFGKKHFTQEEANQTMCDTPYNMGKRYAEVIESMWFTYLYATLIPTGAFFTLVGLGLYYWVDKFNLIKRSSLHHNISGDLAVISLKLLDFTLMIKPIGEMIFDVNLREGSVTVESIVLTCVGGFYMLLPLNHILEFFHDEKFMEEEKTYKEVKENFLHTYQNTHPILSLKSPKKLGEKYLLRSNGNIMSKAEIVDIQQITNNIKAKQKKKRSNMNVNSENLMGSGAYLSKGDDSEKNIKNPVI